MFNDTHRFIVKLLQNKLIHSQFKNGLKTEAFLSCNSVRDVLNIH